MYAPLRQRGSEAGQAAGCSLLSHEQLQGGQRGSESGQSIQSHVLWQRGWHGLETTGEVRVGVVGRLKTCPVQGGFAC